jgi:hypothetical protein
MELVQSGEVRLAVDRHGSGLPVVLIAGIGAGREMWLPSDITATPPPATPAVTRALQLFGPNTLDDDAWMTEYLANAAPSMSPTPGLIGQQLASTAYDNRLRGRADRRIGGHPPVVGLARV